MRSGVWLAYVERCTTFEQRYGMSTETFLERFEAGALGDQPEWFDWHAAAQGKQLWSRKHTILEAPHMTAREYYGAVLSPYNSSTVVTSQQIEFDEQDVYVAYLKGSVNLVDSSTFFFAQYVQIDNGRGQITWKKASLPLASLGWRDSLLLG